MYKDNSLWQFFASVKLALLIIFLIASTSIIGTVIPQKESFEWYAAQYGSGAAHFFHILDIPDMYSSWWFVALLLLLCFNLVICSIDRFPNVWKQIAADGLEFPAERLEKMNNRSEWLVDSSPAETADQLHEKLSTAGWRCTSLSLETGTIFFSQKGAWTRAGVYIVHASILLIFAGALIGSLGGFKGSIVIPEGESREKVIIFGSGEINELGFEVRCNRFDIDFYKNGMPKAFTSNLTILENGNEILTRDIMVNSPLTHKGITFYQSSYEPYQNFIVSVTNRENGRNKSFSMSFQQQLKWEEENVSFGIINARAIGQSVVSSKIWFRHGTGKPVTEWSEKGGAPVSVKTDAGTYDIVAKQMYATGLQVAKDPGVWWVYAGCGLMLFGLYAAFFLSHRRIWLKIDRATDGSRILLAGTSNKNRAGFEKTFGELELHLK